MSSLLKDKFIKFHTDGLVFYIRKELKDTVMSDPRFLDDLSSDTVSNCHTMMSYSDFVINTIENNIVKCRFDLELILDEVTNV